MKAVIIENDINIAEALAKLLAKLPQPSETIKILSSAKTAINFLKTGSQPAIVFCNVIIDKQESFAIFKQEKKTMPVIYFSKDNNHAMQSLNYNAIGYLMMPFEKKAIIQLIEKYNSFQHFFTVEKEMDTAVLNVQSIKNTQDSSLIVNWKDKIIPVKIKEIALFNIEYKMAQVVTFSNRKYFITDTLEALEDICGADFYRANRQFLINREVVAEATQHFARKLVLKLKIEGDYEIIISKNRVPEFLSWLRN